MKKDSLVLRIILGVGVVLLLLIPLAMIQSLITERQEYRNSAVTEIGNSWARAQVVGGPVLSVTTESWPLNQDGKKYLVQNKYDFLPDSLNIEAELMPEIRYRGIYEVVLYRSKIKIHGMFKGGRFITDNGDNLYKNEAEKIFSFNISDLKGIEDNVILQLNGNKFEVSPGSKNRDVFESGFFTPVQIDDKNRDYIFELTLDLKGSEQILFLPMGKMTTVNIHSSWNNPSFIGEFLPVGRKISPDGFIAEWKVNHFNRDYPQEWMNKKYDIFSSAFGIKLLMPVDEYQKSMRTSKYGIMIILLTFVSFFMIEIFSKKILHPIQYLLIGLSLVIFYTILLALSEYILFQYSYLITSVLIILLIGLYVKSIYAEGKFGLIIGALLSVFYGFMYVILQLQDYSLLLGNIALFLVLACMMFLTRKINWYEVFGSKNNTR